MTVDLSDVVPVAAVVVPVLETKPTETTPEPKELTPEVSEPDNKDISDEETLRARAQEKFEQAIKDAERQLIDANLNEEYAKENLKAAKANRIECLQHLQRVRSDGVEKILDKLKRDEEKNQTNAQANQHTNSASSQSQPGSETKSDSKADDSWKLIPTDAVLSGIEGLGKKKIETIVDEFKTLGELEAAREMASIKGEHFSAMFPKGIGQKAADQIEERMLDAISRFTIQEKQKISAENQQPHAEPPDEPQQANASQSSPPLPDVVDL